MIDLPTELGATLAFLVGASVGSFVSVLDVKMGFEPARTGTIRVDPDSRVTTPAQRVAYMDDVLRRVSQAPGIERVAITDTLPFGRNRTWGVAASGICISTGYALFGICII